MKKATTSIVCSCGFLALGCLKAPEGVNFEVSGRTVQILSRTVQILSSNQEKGTSGQTDQLCKSSAHGAATAKKDSELAGSLSQFESRVMPRI